VLLVLLVAGLAGCLGQEAPPSDGEAPGEQGEYSEILQKPFDAMIYPVQDHGWDEEPSRRDSYWRMTRWFDQELLGRAAPTGTAEGDRGTR
jgi:hypothetical protein